MFVFSSQVTMRFFLWQHQCYTPLDGSLHTPATCVRDSSLYQLFSAVQGSLVALHQMQHELIAWCTEMRAGVREEILCQWVWQNIHPRGGCRLRSGNWHKVRSGNVEVRRALPGAGVVRPTFHRIEGISCGRASLLLHHRPCEIHRIWLVTTVHTSSFYWFLLSNTPPIGRLANNDQIERFVIIQHSQMGRAGLKMAVLFSRRTAHC